MSGTSLDGIDAVVVRFAPDVIQVLGAAHVAYPESIRDRCLALSASGPDELERAAALAIDLAALHERAILRAVRAADVDPPTVVAVGVHGQTVRHRPHAGFSIQIVDAPRIARAVGIDVVCDFRAADLAVGGQGAPLVPAFHRAAFADRDADQVVLNLGGIANITWLPVDGPLLGFDVGPANMLMDAWASAHGRGPYDADGAWAASGTPDRALLARLLDDPWFEQPPPRSTGRELFNLDWLRPRLTSSIAPQHVQATLCEFVAVSVAQALRGLPRQPTRVLVCGGGASNARLMERLAAHCGSATVTDTRAFGIAPDQVEAAAFAWLAMRWNERLPGNAPSVTGASLPAVLGACHRHGPVTVSAV